MKLPYLHRLWWLVIQKRIARTQEQSVEIDAATIARQMHRIRAALDRVKTINRKVVGSDHPLPQLFAVAFRQPLPKEIAIENAAKLTRYGLKQLAEAQMQHGAVVQIQQASEDGRVRVAARVQARGGPPQRANRIVSAGTHFGSSPAYPFASGYFRKQERNG